MLTLSSIFFSKSEPGYMTSGGVPGEDLGTQNWVLKVLGANFYLEWKNWKTTCSQQDGHGV